MPLKGLVLEISFGYVHMFSTSDAASATITISFFCISPFTPINKIMGVSSIGVFLPQLMSPDYVFQ